LITLRTPSAGRRRRPMAVTTGAVIHPPRRRIQTLLRLHPHRRPGMPTSVRS
jgi:hypothetical protein